ncbi:Site-specific recombinase XerD [Desulfobacula phenolica]|uniref:Site-specific recombinase XerD n=2 Tax=Desulfobacula phenolica TaxID=90732 RepID=A0A1H2HJ36_9BACT|nr:Site-specific recombinase XerD [Desulfobacula phenolica]
MAYQDPKTKKWVRDSRITGCPRKKKRGFRTKREAKQWENARREEMLNPKAEQIQLTTSEACLRYLEHCKRRGFKLNTYRYKANIYKAMIYFWENDPDIKAVDSIMIEEFFDHVFDSSGGKTVNRYKREIKSLFNYLRKRHLIDNDPTSPIDDYEEEVFKKYVPPPEDIHAVLNVANEFESDIIRTAYHTAARSGEIRQITCEDIDLKNNALTLWTRKRKNGNSEADTIDMSQSLRKILQNRLIVCTKDCPWLFPSPKCKQLSKYTFDNIMPRLCKKANVKPFGFHAIRHHIAVQLAHKNWPLIKIQKFLRHKRATTTDIYLRSLINIKSSGASIIDDIELEMKALRSELR